MEKSHHVDVADADASGTVDYRYEYDLFTFSNGQAALVARSYKGEAEEAHFLRVEEGGKARRLRPSDLGIPLLKEATDLLRNEGKSVIRWLGPTGYQPVPSH
jgi:hypothetical protein